MVKHNAIRMLLPRTHILLAMSPSLLAVGTMSFPQRSVAASQFRGLKTSETPKPDEYSGRYKAIVVGAGPAGIAVVGNLLEQKVKPILWLARGPGRLHRSYREVPSNTKVKRFVMYAEGVEPFKQVLENAEKPNAYTHLKGLDQEKTCHIAEAADLCAMLSKGLGISNEVTSVIARADLASWSLESGWTSTYRQHSEMTPRIASSDILVLCTGSKPIETPLIGLRKTQMPNRIELDSALKPTLLKKLINPEKEAIIAVVGASHSAILVLRNLYNLASSSHPLLRIKWFTRHPLRYAVEKHGWILRDNTGLKGEVATWAAENLEEDKLPSSDVSKYLTKIVTPKDVAGEAKVNKEHVIGCDYLIQAIGYKPSRVLKLSVDGVTSPHDSKVFYPDGLDYNHQTGGFADKEGKKVPGLYGAGIAYPEKVVDPEGNVEFAVGLWKFMSYLKRVVPNWTKD